MFITARDALSAILITTAASLVVACAPREAATDADRVEVEKVAPQPGGTLVRRLSQDVNTLNLLLQTLETEKYVLSLLYDPLLDINADMELVPALAESWEVSRDG